MPAFTTHLATNEDQAFLWDILWDVTSENSDMLALGRERALRLPEVNKYLSNWGRPGDAGVVVSSDIDGPIGAAWYRLFTPLDESYGFAGVDIPELTIGVKDGWRGAGAGTALMSSLLQCARSEGYRAISLSVDRRNRARHLYEQFGFRDAVISQPSDSSITLIRSL